MGQSKVDGSELKFIVEVTPVTSKILQELAFEHGWGWQDSGQKVGYLHHSNLIFFPDEKIISLGIIRGDCIYDTLSLEEAINEITSVGADKFEKNDFAVIQREAKFNNCFVRLKYRSKYNKWMAYSVWDDTRLGEFSFSELHKPSDKEIESRLTTIAVNKGFKEGITCRLGGEEKHLRTIHSDLTGMYFNKEKGQASYGLQAWGHLIYKASKNEWAEIIEQPKVLGHEVRYLGSDQFQFGCESSQHIFTRSELKRVRNALGNLTDNSSTFKLYKNLHELLKK